MKKILSSYNGYYIFSAILIFLLLITTSHYSYEDALRLNQLDSKSYYEISKNFPNFIFNETIPFHHYQRLILPYIIGCIAFFTDIKIIYLYKFFVIFFLILIAIIHKKIFNLLNYNFEISIVSLSVVIFSPYLSRYIMSIPLMLVDLGFVLISYLVILAYISKSKLLGICIAISLIFRLTGIGILISYLIIYSKNFYKNYKQIFLTVLVSISLIIILSSISNNLTGSKFSNLHYLGIFEEFKLENFLNTVLFILKPFFCLIPLFSIIIFSKLNKKNINLNNLIFFFLTPIMFIGQPILGGELVTGNNIFRLSSLSLPFLVVGLSMITKREKIFFERYLIIILINFLFSLHPSYSIIRFFFS